MRKEKLTAEERRLMEDKEMRAAHRTAVLLDEPDTFVFPNKVKPFVYPGEDK